MIKLKDKQTKRGEQKRLNINQSKRLSAPLATLLCLPATPLLVFVERSSGAESGILEGVLIGV